MSVFYPVLLCGEETAGAVRATNGPSWAISSGTSNPLVQALTLEAQAKKLVHVCIISGTTYTSLKFMPNKGDGSFNN